MPIATSTLAATARRYTEAMTSIRGRRVQRLLMREFARFDHVLPALAEDGSPALLALAADGSAAVCHTDGRGAEATIVACARLSDATVTTAYSLAKDSLPALSWTIWHPGLARAVGALRITVESLTDQDAGQVAQLISQATRPKPPAS